MCVRKLICAILSVILLLGTAVTAWAEDTATLTITPDKTEVTANGSAVQVKFTITVMPPEGRDSPKAACPRRRAWAAPAASDAA